MVSKKAELNHNKFSFPFLDKLDRIYPDFSAITNIVAKVGSGYVFPDFSFIPKTVSSINIDHIASIIAGNSLGSIRVNDFLVDLSSMTKAISAIQMSSFLAGNFAADNLMATAAFKPFIPEYHKFIDVMSSFDNFSIFQDVKQITNQIRKSQTFTTYNDAIAFRYLPQFNTDDTARIEVELSKIKDNFVNVKKGRLSLEFFLALFLSLSLFVMSEYNSTIATQEIRNSIDNSKAQLFDEIHKLRSCHPDGKYYVILRETWAYSDPSTASRLLAIILYPNQKVRIVKSKGKWIYIEYFNNLTNKHDQVWCLKKYCQMIEVR